MPLAIASQRRSAAEPRILRLFRHASFRRQADFRQAVAASCFSAIFHVFFAADIYWPFLRRFFFRLPPGAISFDFRFASLFSPLLYTHRHAIEGH
jgi:hypothetical protein